ncbi:protein translocase subunit SecF [Methanocella sp. CWC-04]|uniref:Protein-export membrane protein SecF n=1 Tax=Methanooceanicella nereidis TaxID=2052831 RepID=A0AAP2RBZ4_9EURY|nr:protein translocase subunit SecF [Methanocella sp. CWC-04]MCD1294678.1 protein translocase subunit SecF [Methanocella sp. CWC-04]
MKVDDSKKGKTPIKTPEGKKDPGKNGGLFSKLKFPELPVKQAITIPLVVLLFAILIVGYTQLTESAPVHLGLDFKGGSMVTIHTDKTDQQLQEEFSNYPIKLIAQGSGGEKTLRFSTMDDRKQEELAEYVNKNYEGAMIEYTGSVFSQANQSQAVIAILVAFLGMAITVFIIFRNFVPSVAVVLSAFSDIMIAAALMNIFGIELTFGTFAALLMLIGYSVDTDILLTTKILGERKYIDKKIASCRATGLTMTFSAIAAFLMLYIVSKYSFVVGLSPIPVLSSIAIVMMFGLIADIMNTWFLNTGLLRWYMDTPEAKAKYG